MADDFCSLLKAKIGAAPDGQAKQALQRAYDLNCGVSTQNDEDEIGSGPHGPNPPPPPPPPGG